MGAIGEHLAYEYETIQRLSGSFVEDVCFIVGGCLEKCLLP